MNYYIKKLLSNRIIAIKNNRTTALVILNAATIWVVYIFIGRSIWVDEGMLLKSITESVTWADYFMPLPHYDQAQPMLISWFHHMIVHKISTYTEALRLATFITCLIISSPIAYVLSKEKIESTFIVLLFLAFSSSMTFYLTEIKHYAFEIAASFLMLAILYLKLTKKINFALAALLIPLTANIGFSTYIAAAALLLSIVADEIANKTYNFFNATSILTLFVAGAISIAAIVHMNSILVYQIDNFDAYYSKGFWKDIYGLIRSSAGAHGVLLTIVTAISVVLGLLAKRSSFFFQLTFAFLISVILVVIGKLVGIYPASAARHLMWLTPFSFVLILLALNSLIANKNIKAHFASVVMTTIITIQAAYVLFRVFIVEDIELANNKYLYNFLAELPPANVVVFPYAQPTLEYYRILLENLSRHNFIGLENTISSKKDPSKFPERTRSRIDAVASKFPKGKFYYIISHQGPLFASNKGDRITFDQWRGEYTEMSIEKSGCSYKEVITDVKVQLLEIECKPSQP